MTKGAPWHPLRGQRGTPRDLSATQAKHSWTISNNWRPLYPSPRAAACPQPPRPRAWRRRSSAGASMHWKSGWASSCW
ncbi:hypothetical protein CBM2609_A100235 [Cupriavidus taiwanensis]|nr:hypothetical protein CBM2604_A80231 [Cupriavidus taiwanensis]SOZ22429.1 hypothetical protein CBM2609_A100235 [Cupriavidus taiwanensis]SOZ41935.1 hypothetical protein CBM2610_A100231 [Cupriavidus taiwanensis]